MTCAHLIDKPYLQLYIYTALIWSAKKIALYFIALLDGTCATLNSHMYFSTQTEQDVYLKDVSLALSRAVQKIAKIKCL